MMGRLKPSKIIGSSKEKSPELISEMKEVGIRIKELEARLKDLHYVTDLNVDIMIEYITYDEDGNKINEKSAKKMVKNVNIGKIPIMVHSKLCILNDQPASVLSEMGEVDISQMGKVIGAVMAKGDGIDGGTVSKIVKGKLS